MEARIYSNEELSIESYHASAGVSNSSLKELRQTPFHYYSKYLDPNRPAPKPETTAKKIGRAFHCLLAEPEIFPKQFCLQPKKADFPQHPSTIEEIIAFASERGISLPKGKRDALIAALREKAPDLKLWEEAEGELISGKVLLSVDQWDACHRMVEAVMKHPAAKLLFRKGRFEHSYYWIHPTTGELCKTRPDWVSDEAFIVDPKTSEDASHSEFQRSAWNFDYHVQAAMAVDGVAALTGVEMPFINLVVEKEWPYAVALYEQDAPELIEGRIAYLGALETLAQCRRENRWPSYPPTIQKLGRPRWAQKAGL